MRPIGLLPLAFGAFGVVWGAWQAVLPDLADHHDLSSGPLGIILTAGFAVSLPVMLGAGRLLDRSGAGTAIALTAAAMAVGLLLVGALAPLNVMVAGVLLFTAGSGAFDVAINGAAMGDDEWSTPARLTLLHAAFSGGGVVGAVAAGAAIGSGVPFGLTYVVVAVGVLLVAAVAAAGRWRPAGRRGSVPRAVAMAMLPLAALAGLAFLIEGSMETWSAIYLRDVLGAAAFVGALGPATFHAAMLMGRLGGAGVARVLGGPGTLLLAGSLTAAGMAAALLVPVPILAIPGMAIAALGASFVVPVAVSLAAARAGDHAGRAASYVLSLGYAGFLIGPSLVGMLGELGGLRMALVVVPLAATFIAAGSRLPQARD